MKFNFFLIVLLLLPLTSANSISFDRDESGHLTLEDITYFTKGYQAGILSAESYLYLLSQIDKKGEIECQVLNDEEMICLQLPLEVTSTKQAEFVQNYFIRAFYPYTNVTFVEKPGILSMFTGKVTDDGYPENLDECLDQNEAGYGKIAEQDCYAIFNDDINQEEEQEIDECLEYGECVFEEETNEEQVEENPNDEVEPGLTVPEESPVTSEDLPDEKMEDPHKDTPYIEKDGKKYYLDTEKGFFGNTKAVWKADDGSEMSSREATKAIKNGAQFVDPKNPSQPNVNLPAPKTINPPVNPNPQTRPPITTGQTTTSDDVRRQNQLTQDKPNNLPSFRINMGGGTLSVYSERLTDGKGNPTDTSERGLQWSKPIDSLNPLDWFRKGK